VMARGLAALDAAGIEPVGLQKTTRDVDVQFIVPKDRMQDAIRALHGALVENNDRRDKPRLVA